MTLKKILNPNIEILNNIKIQNDQDSRRPVILGCCFTFTPKNSYIHHIHPDPLPQVGRIHFEQVQKYLRLKAFGISAECRTSIFD
jgi:hypothetical protein